MGRLYFFGGGNRKINDESRALNFQFESIFKKAKKIPL